MEQPGKFEREFRLIKELDLEIMQLQMSKLFPPGAQKVEGVPYLIEPGKI
jgi:hypothetical protein